MATGGTDFFLRGLVRPLFAYRETREGVDPLVWATKVHLRSASMLDLEVERYVDVVPNLHKWDAYTFGHPVVLAVEDHLSLDLSQVPFLVGKDERNLLGQCFSPYHKVAIDLNGVVADLDEFGGAENNHRIVLRIEKIFAFQLAVLHAASGVYTVRLYCHYKRACSDIRRLKCQHGIPLVKFTRDRNRGLYVKLDRAVYWRYFKNRDS